MDTVPLPSLRLAWKNSQLYWIAHTDEESIYVPTDIHDEIMIAHLSSLGIHRQTWTQYISPAEKAWRRQQQEEENLRASGVQEKTEIQEYLLGLEIRWQTWTQYLAPAEDAWQRQCQEEEKLRANLPFWKQISGVWIARKGEREQRISGVRIARKR